MIAGRCGAFNAVHHCSSVEGGRGGWIEPSGGQMRVFSGASVQISEWESVEKWPFHLHRVASVRRSSWLRVLKPPRMHQPVQNQIAWLTCNLVGWNELFFSFPCIHSSTHHYIIPSTLLIAASSLAPPLCSEAKTLTNLGEGGGGQWVKGWLLSHMRLSSHLTATKNPEVS